MREIINKLKETRCQKFKTFANLCVKFNSQYPNYCIDYRFISKIESNPDNITISKFFVYIEFLGYSIVLKRNNRLILLEPININQQLSRLRVIYGLTIMDFSSLSKIPEPVICRIEYQNMDLRFKTVKTYLESLDYKLILKSHIEVVNEGIL